jgi:hypothetical protein
LRRLDSERATSSDDSRADKSLAEKSRVLVAERPAAAAAGAGGRFHG